MYVTRQTLIAACACVLLGAAGPARPTSATPVPLQSHPNTKADAIARSLSAEDLQAARARGVSPLVLIGRAALGGAQPALFVQLQSEQDCGSAGCATSVYSWERGRWDRVLDSASGGLSVSAKKTRGRNDLISDDDHFAWTGTRYQSLVPVPAAIDLRPRTRKR